MKSLIKRLISCICMFLSISFIAGCTSVKFPDDGVYISDDPYVSFTHSTSSIDRIKMKVKGEEIVELRISLSYDGRFKIYEKSFDENLITESEHVFYQGQFQVDWRQNLILSFDDGEQITLIKQ